MNGEPDELDPHEIKVLADILALVLEDRPGPSAVALDALRRKARQHRVTGGAIKNLFQAMLANPPDEAPPTAALDAVPDDPEGMLNSIARLRATNRNLERALAAANGEAATLRGDFDAIQSRLTEAQKLIRVLAERARAGRSKAALVGAGIATCVAVLAGAIIEHLPGHPAASAALAPTAASPPAPQASLETPPQPMPLAPNRAASPEATGPRVENDPELQQALQRLSRAVRPVEPAPEHGEAPAPAAKSNGDLPLSAASALPPETYNAIVKHISACWRANVSRLGDPRHQAHVRVVADAEGVVREANLVPEDVARMSDPSFEEFAHAAIRSVLDPQCSQLPIPEPWLGHRIAFDFMFVP